MNVYSRDAVFLSGVPVFYSYDPSKCLEAREIEQLIAIATEGYSRWGKGRAVDTAEFAARPADYPSSYLWVLPSCVIPWRETVKVRVGRAAVEFDVEYLIPCGVITSGDRPSSVRLAHRAVERECRKRWGDGKLDCSGRQIRYHTKKR